MAKRAAGFVIYRKIADEIQYLFLRASYGSHHWTPPKGHVDPGEDDYTTAVRETHEEAGYNEDDLKIYKNISKILNYNVKNKPKIVVYYLAELIKPEKLPKLSDEHEDFKWVNKADSAKLSQYKDMCELIQFCEEKIQQLPK